jgi:hypothetical protein
MICINKLVRGIFLAAAVLLAAGCGPSGYVVKAPSPSGMKYETAMVAAKSELALIDNRQEAGRTFHSGRLTATLKSGDAPIDPPKFLAVHLREELLSRGIPVQVSPAGKGLPRLNLTTFRVENWRATGFSPFITLTFLSADLETGATRKRFGTFIKRGKVPVWSFDEVVDPTFSEPLSLAVKELASKIANQLYGYRASNKSVDELIAKASGTKGADNYLQVYALGFTNNPRAIDALVRLTGDADEYVRLAAISSLGNLRATSQFNLLRSIHQNDKVIWQDRAMAIKAIGDLDTAESRAFLAQQLKYWEGQPGSNETSWMVQIIRLYV